MRHDQLTRFEARAARLPVLLTVPMIVFILPAVPGGRGAGHAAGVAAVVRPLLRDRRGATAVEFALVGSAFFTVLLLLLMEASWQVAIGAGLHAGRQGGLALGRHRPGAAGRLQRDRLRGRHHPEDLRHAARQPRRAQRDGGQLSGLRVPVHPGRIQARARRAERTWCATPWSIAAAG